MSIKFPTIDADALEHVIGGLSLMSLYAMGKKSTPLEEFAQEPHAAVPASFTPLAAQHAKLFEPTTVPSVVLTAATTPPAALTTPGGVNPDLARVLTGLQQDNATLQSQVRTQTAHTVAALQQLQQSQLARQLDASQISRAAQQQRLASQVHSLQSAFGQSPQSAATRTPATRQPATRSGDGGRRIDSGEESPLRSSTRGGRGGYDGGNDYDGSDHSRPTRSRSNSGSPRPDPYEHEPAGLPVQAGEREWHPPRERGTTPGMLRPTSQVVRDITDEELGQHEPAGLPVQAGEREWHPPRERGTTPGMLRPTSQVVRDITDEELGQHEPAGLPVQAGEREWHPPRERGTTPGMLRPTSEVVRDITDEEQGEHEPAGLPVQAGDTRRLEDVIATVPEPGPSQRYDDSYAPELRRASYESSEESIEPVVERASYVSREPIFETPTYVAEEPLVEQTPIVNADLTTQPRSSDEAIVPV